MRSRKTYRYCYLPSDFLAAALSWFLLFHFRKLIIEDLPFTGPVPEDDSNFYLGLIGVPLAWTLLHLVTGTYTDLFRKSRLRDLFHTLMVSAVGSVVLFFALLLDDRVRGYGDYYLTMLLLLISHFVFTYGFRLIWLQWAKAQLTSGKVQIPALVMGRQKEVEGILPALKEAQLQNGLNVVHQMIGEPTEPFGKEKDSIVLEHLQQLPELVERLGIEEVILAFPSSEHQLINQVLNKLADKEVWIKIVPDMYDILSGTTRIHHIVGEAFIEIPPRILKEWQRITKRWFDVLFASLGLLVLSPLLLLLALAIRRGSKGPVFYRQERLGQYGQPFYILKFRSMYTDAEVAGPALSTENDRRITPQGKILRKYRLDELPQFINVLKGEMSIVGPRAERRYYADQIIAQAPYYTHVLKVKPGITSLGMVKYGYASTVEEMVKRLRFDIIYIENMSFLMDLKILLYTVRTVLLGKGK